jgi:hypothetical protein
MRQVATPETHGARAKVAKSKIFVECFVDIAFTGCQDALRSVGVCNFVRHTGHLRRPRWIQHMAIFDIPDDNLKRSELAWELVELFGELPTEQINEVLAKNVPLETLEFFASYAEDFGSSERIQGNTLKRLPNLLLLGYLLRVLEDRLIEGENFDA